jgi:glycosyltransferase involved in cell wall biosynthesis
MTQTKQKIIYFITQSEWGGAQKYVFDLATNIDQNSYEVLIACGQGNGELTDRLTQKKFKTLRLKWTRRSINPFKDLLALIEIIKILKREKPEIVHLNSSKISILGSLSVKIAEWLFGLEKIKIIYTAHGWVFNEPLAAWKKKFYILAEKLTSNLKSKIITVSDYDFRQALKYKITTPEKLFKIKNQINRPESNFLDKNLAREKIYQFLKKNKSNLNLTENIKIAGTIANLYPTKGLEYLIKAAKIVLEKDKQLIFIVIGDGILKNDLNQLIIKLNLTDNFFLLGQIKNASHFLKGFDLFILPSVKEGLPYTILEAKAAGVPIITTKVGGLPEIVNPASLVEPADVQGLAEKIIDFFNKEWPENIPANQPAIFKEFLDKTYSTYN